ncbi:hypothetical protein E2562_021388 [Oryza meyeriana var. granulata]|uniref:Uncharacterized protein n=1 Tax=Oryza meyeriana var. granulata TaxID=110450 RepID=A0A6G1EXI6_9ORYZ|nr:hypothetical protein E2562_021388 [Oryza meyeriana var. granulata]
MQECLCSVGMMALARRMDHGLVGAIRGSGIEWHFGSHRGRLPTTMEQRGGASRGPEGAQASCPVW